MSRLQDAIGIRKKRVSLDGSRGRLHLAVDVVEASFQWVDAAVGQDQLKAFRPVLHRHGGHAGYLVGMIEIKLLGQGEVRLDGIDGGDRRHRCVRIDQVADVRDGAPGDTFNGRRDLGVAEVNLRGVYGGLCGVDVSLRGEVVLEFGLVFLLADGPGLDQCRVAREILLRALFLRLIIGERGQGLIEIGLEGLRVDFEEKIACLDHRALGVGLLNQVTGDLRMNLRVG